MKNYSYLLVLLSLKHTVASHRFHLLQGVIFQKISGNFWTHVQKMDMGRITSVLRYVSILGVSKVFVLFIFLYI